MGKPGASPSSKWTGTKGDDVVYVATREALAGTVYDGAAGNDTLNLSTITSGGVSLSLNLNSGGGSRVWANSPFHGSWSTYIFGLSGPVVENTIKNIERVVGTNFNDYISIGGGSGTRIADGGGGDDAIYVTGSSGISIGVGGTGSDQLFGSRNTDILIGGTYNGGVAARDGESDTFVMSSGTILDFELGTDRLFLDVGGAPTNASWVNVSVSGYGAGARLTVDATHVITLIGVDAATMNAIPKGYVLATNVSQVISGPGDDLIPINLSPGADQLIFGGSTGHDEVVGFSVTNDTLSFANAPTFEQASYHGDSALLATYDSGASTVLLIGLSAADIPNLHYDLLA